MDLDGLIVEFAYGTEVRTVLVGSVWSSLDGHRLITGLDELRNEVRSFRVDRIIGEVKVHGQTRHLPSH